MSKVDLPGTPSNIFTELFRQEVMIGERISWLFRWVVHGVAFLLAIVVFFVQDDIVGFYGMCLLCLALGYNGFLGYLIRRQRTDRWIRYVSVTVDIVFLTLYNAIDTFLHSPLTPVTTATLLLYPALIFLASLRQDRKVIVYATILTAFCMNVLFALAYRNFDFSIASQLICGDILGQIYRTAYVLLFGFLLLFIPSTINRLLKAQKKMIEHNLENFEKAHHDTLTGLANRRLLMDFLTKSIALSGRKNRRVAVIYLDLDGFKPINDQLGHDVGDQVLVCVAKRILSVVRESDLASRVGGDEFVVVAQEIDGRSGAEIMARRILEAIQEPMMIQEKKQSLGVSIGVAIYPQHGSTAEELVHVADKAMYLVKKGSKSDFTILD
ncbi:MAG: GGDEF domain-containing protein [Fibrobacterota bacterium]|nr:GGDEF domain-containing protein [Fibrobacterota bacterium]QQS07409.1 MAG: GGDEF domain-containing protein [Fibrobacterota bacterium]